MHVSFYKTCVRLTVPLLVCRKHVGKSLKAFVKGLLCLSTVEIWVWRGLRDNLILRWCLTSLCLQFVVIIN